MAILNKRIKELREAAGKTLLELAEDLGVKEATVQRYESGKIKNIKHETIAKLAKIFDVDPAYLMGWEDDAIMQDGRHPGYMGITHSAEQSFMEFLSDMNHHLVGDGETLELTYPDKYTEQVERDDIIRMSRDVVNYTHILLMALRNKDNPNAIINVYRVPSGAIDEPPADYETGQAAYPVSQGREDELLPHFRALNDQGQDMIIRQTKALRATREYEKKYIEHGILENK
jgi:transcriptional regulator with XRE-family HTH domain